MKTQTLRQLQYFTVICSIFFFTGCVSTHKSEPKKFGSSVKMMIKSQIYDRSTIKNPPLDVVEGMDSTKAINDLRKVYRKSQANKRQIKVLDAPGDN